MTRTARIFIAETIGTMILILGGPGTVMFGQFLGFDIGVLGVSLAFGLSLLCAAYLFGHISGCHINPAVTLGMWALRRTAGRDVPTYLIGQILGAALGGFVIWAILASGDNPGGSRFVRGQALRRSLERLRQPLAERLRARRGHHRRDRLDRVVHPRDRGHHAVLGHRGFAGILIGLMLALVHMISIPIDNTSVNPARSFGTALFAGLRRLVGARAALGVHRVPHHRRVGRGADLARDHHARGRGRDGGGAGPGSARGAVVEPGRARSSRQCN